MDTSFPPLPLPDPARRLLALLASHEVEHLLGLVRAAGNDGVTAGELTVTTGLSQPSISRLLNELNGLGMVRVERSRPTRRGRPPHRWRVRRSGAWSVLALAARVTARR